MSLRSPSRQSRQRGFLATVDLSGKDTHTAVRASGGSPIALLCTRRRLYVKLQVGVQIGGYARVSLTCRVTPRAAE
jgi:hypothetical protein